LPLARNAARKLRTLRHPGIIKVLEVIETESTIYVATEKVTPLSWHIKRKSLSEETVKWGLYTVASTLKFVNDDASSVHGSVRASSIYTSDSGEWKLGGFDILSSMKEDDAIIYNFGSLTTDSNRYMPPEIGSNGWTVIKRNPLPAVDAYGLGVLIYESFNGNFMGSDQLGQPKNIPAGMVQSYRKLINPNPKLRLSPGHFLEQGMKAGGFFETPLINITKGADSLGLKSETERDEFLR
jgi:SCY1-like protein 1